MKAFIFLAFILFPFISFAQTFGKVVAIKDGDTVVVLLRDNNQKTLRLAEVDCPESGQPFGKNAKEFTSSQIFGREIMFEEMTNDRYGRTIAKIYYSSDLKYLSAEIIKAGFGWWYLRYSNDITLKHFQQNAQNKELGLWSDKDAIAPWDWRKIK